MIKLLGIIILAIHSWASEPISILPNANVQKRMKDHNLQLRQLTRFSLADEMRPSAKFEVVRPFAEYETAKHIIFSADFPFHDALVAKTTILDSLPAGVSALIFSYWPSELADKAFGKYIKAGRAKMVNVGGYNGFWARDGVPVPVYAQGSHGLTPALVDARYGHGFEADKAFGNLFGAEVIKHEYFFEGGNFMNDDKGNCFVVNTEAVMLIPDNIFRDYYGCQKLHRLPFVAGIGHVDERVKFISNRIVLTDVIEYESILRGLGYEVRLLPRGGEEYETYINSLIVNGTVFLPIFEEVKDTEVIELYTNLGLKVIPIKVDALPNMGMGAIHCMTMSYPEMPKAP